MQKYAKIKPYFHIFLKKKHRKYGTDIVILQFVFKVCNFTIQVSTSEMLVSNAAQSLEEFYPSVAIATLMRIIRDPNLHQHHNQVIFTENLSAS